MLVRLEAPQRRLGLSEQGFISISDSLIAARCYPKSLDLLHKEQGERIGQGQRKAGHLQSADEPVCQFPAVILQQQGLLQHMGGPAAFQVHREAPKA